MTAKSNPCLDELNKQRKSKDKCDVTIQIDDETFPCHRGILSSWSSYFKAMFDGNYKESESNIITIKEIDPTTFEEILDAMYTGKITITAANACRLLKACSFLALNEFEKSCLKFFEENLLVDHLVELCLYADLLKEDKLFNEMTKCIAEKFAILSQTYDFSTLSSSIFQAILSQPTLDRSDDIVFLEITKWVKRNSIDDPYSAFEKFLQAAKLTTVSPLVLGKLLLSTEDVVEIKEAISKLNETKGTLRIAGVVKPTLKVYLKASVEKITGQPNVISLAYAPENEDQNWILADVFNSPFDNLKTVWIGKQQYFLSYQRNECAKDSCQFWMVEDRKTTALRKPPAIAERFELVELEGTIFLYFIDAKARIIDKKNSESTEENINMLYFYYPERDEWFSSPEMKHTVKGAAFVGLGYNLCLLGGLQGPRFDKFYHRAQRWDARCSVWDENDCSVVYNSDFSIADETLEFCYGAACVDGSLVCISGSYHGNQFWRQCYSCCNFTSGSSDWRKFGDDMIRARGNHNTLTLFNDEIYAIDNSLSLPFSSVEKFVKNNDNYWNGDEVSPLPKKVVSSKGIFYTGDVTATVVSSY